MRNFLLAASAVAALLTAPLLLGRAEAAPVAPAGINLAIQDLSLVDNVQYVYGGYKHCWYPGGWHGAGWYRCGYRWRRGLGWGGPVGWNGWAAPGPVVVVRPRPRRPVVVIRP